MHITDLLGKLDALSAWRKKELSQARFLAENAKNEEARRYLCRVWVLVMYAHCDNFLKESTRIYLEYLKCNINKLTKYKKELMWSIVKGPNLLGAAENKYKSINDCFQNAKNVFFDENVTSQILTIGSFDYKLLRYYCDWILQINFNHSNFRDFCKVLKDKRNRIAHGEESYVNLPDDCLPWHIKTIKFIDLLKDALIENAISELNDHL